MSRTDEKSTIPTDKITPTESISYTPPGGYQKYSFLYNSSLVPQEYDVIFTEGNGEYYPNTIVEFSFHFKDENKVPYLILFQGEEVPYQESYNIKMPWVDFRIAIYFTDTNPVIDRSLPNESKSVSLTPNGKTAIGIMNSNERRYPIYDEDKNIVYTLTPGDIVTEYKDGDEVKFGILTPAMEAKGTLAKVIDEIYLFVPKEEENLFYFAQPLTWIKIDSEYYMIKHALGSGKLTLDQEVTALYNTLETNEYGSYNISIVVLK